MREEDAGVDAEAATTTADCSQQVKPPATIADHTAMDIIESQQDEDIGQNHGYISDTEMSQKELLEEIKNLVENSIERRVKRRTTNKRKRKRKGYKILADEEEGSGDDTKSYSRCSIPYVYLVFQSIICSDHRKALVKKMGFEHLLDLDDCNVPRSFAQWIADNTMPESGTIMIGEKSIPISPNSFEQVLGIPAGELPVETDEMAGKACFLWQGKLVFFSSLDYQRYQL